MGAPIWINYSGLKATKESGRITFADRVTLVDIFEGQYADCVAGLLARGVFGVGARAGWVCTSSMAEQIERGGVSRLTINWEAGGVFATEPLPADDFSLQPQELYPRIERSPFFNGITQPTLALAYQTINGATNVARQAALDRLNTLADSTQKALGLALSSKLQKGEETFYLAYMRYIWISWSYTFPSLSIGGVISAPGGPLTGRFGSFSSLRLADSVEPAGVNGSMFKIMRTWLVAQSGYWDTDLNG